MRNTFLLLANMLILSGLKLGRQDPHSAHLSSILSTVEKRSLCKLAKVAIMDRPYAQPSDHQELSAQIVWVRSKVQTVSPDTHTRSVRNQLQWWCLKGLYPHLHGLPTIPQLRTLHSLSAL